MDFTREPIIETIITPREGYRLAIRSSKNVGQEEHFVDAIEVVSFGSAFFFRSLERPKPFMVPIGDYEILEVREPRMVLKTQVAQGSLKIQNGGQSAPKEQRRAESMKEQVPQAMQAQSLEKEPGMPSREARPRSADRAEKRRDRRRGFRKREREAGMPTEAGAQKEGEQMQPLAPLQVEKLQGEKLQGEKLQGEKLQGEKPFEQKIEGESVKAEDLPDIGAPTLLRAVLPPPSTLIRDDIQRLRESDVYRGAFFVRDAEGAEGDDDASIASFEADVEFQNAKKKEASFEEEPFLSSIQTNIPESVEGERTQAPQNDLP